MSAMEGPLQQTQVSLPLNIGVVRCFLCLFGFLMLSGPRQGVRLTLFGHPLSSGAYFGLAFDLTSEYAYYCKIQLNATMSTLSSTDDEANLERFKSQVTDFLESLIPEMTEVLPDWRDFEGEPGLEDA